MDDAYLKHLLKHGLSDSQIGRREVAETRIHKRTGGVNVMNNIVWLGSSAEDGTGEAMVLRKELPKLTIRFRVKDGKLSRTLIEVENSERQLGGLVA
ncbi:unnamed protein product [Dibothriocephalus latus]|uniref:Uncharacterized protein n=1 Tax=Dibothriocephalus latus TaxID=60516 RepID=A0A3P6TY29_DIBLA|nr:unnamed protein product [Dibothriocephalus latus]